MRFVVFYRDQKDGRYVREKISLRHAKEIFESTAKLEREFKHLFSGKYCVVNDQFWPNHGAYKLEYKSGFN